MFLRSYIRKKLRERGARKFFNIKYYTKRGYKNGFCPTTIDVCGITSENYKDFLTDRDYMLGHPYNGAYSGIIDNKLFLPLLFHNYKEYIPKYFYFKDKYGFLPLDDNTITRSSVRMSNSAFFLTLSEEHTLVLKHTHSSVGKGFMLVKQEGNGFYLNNKVITKGDLERVLDSLDDYIVTEYVNQHSYASDICSTSLNTIRFLCMWDRDKKEFFLARCFQRFGCGGNIVDNLGSGNAYCVFVDVETGEFSSDGAVNYNHSGDRVVKNIVHPDHEVLLTGIKIPNFVCVKSKILEMANSFSYLKYIGFDVAITDSGFKIIEVNSFSSLEVSQQCEGFLSDARIRKSLGF